MKKLQTILLGVLLIYGITFSQDVDMEQEKEAIKQAALDYIDGAHEGSAVRMERAVHPELTKVTLMKLPQTGKTVLRKAGSTRLIELIRANVAPLDEDKRNIKVTIFAVKEGLAAVRAVSAMFYDYLLVAKIDGQWKLINVLWRNNDKPDTEGDAGIMETEKAAIEQTALDYIDGSFSGDEIRMERALHPELMKVIPVTLPQTGKTMLDKMGAQLLIEGTRAKLGMVDEEKRNIEVTIFDVNQDIAMVEVISAMYYDYLQIAKFNGQWKIINVLWKMNPTAPRPSRR